MIGTIVLPSPNITTLCSVRGAYLVNSALFPDMWWVVPLSNIKRSDFELTLLCLIDLTTQAAILVDETVSEKTLTAVSE